MTEKQLTGNHFIGIKIKSHGTPQGKCITTSQGAPITTVTKFTIVMDAIRGRSKAIIECALPELEMEMPSETVDFIPGTQKQCPKCGELLTPEMVMRGKPVGKPFAKYTCLPCQYEKEYAFEFNWEGENREFDQESIAAALKEADSNDSEQQDS